MPVDVCTGAVTICFPCGQFLPEFVDTCYPPRKTLSCHDIKLYLCHVQPASVLWGIMKLQVSGNPACLISRESLVQRSYGMSIEIVHDKYDLLFVRVTDVYKIFDFLSPVGCSTVFTDTYMPYAPQWLNKHKYTACAVSDIFGIGLPGIEPRSRTLRAFLRRYYHPSPSAQRRCSKRGPPNEIGHSRGGASSKIHAAVDAYGNPVYLMLSEGQRNDINFAIPVLEHVN